MRPRSQQKDVETDHRFFVRFYYLYLDPLLGDIILTIKWAILVVAALHEQG